MGISGDGELVCGKKKVMGGWWVGGVGVRGLPCMQLGRQACILA